MVVLNWLKFTYVSRDLAFQIQNVQFGGKQSCQVLTRSAKGLPQQTHREKLYEQTIPLQMRVRCGTQCDLASPKQTSGVSY